MEAEEEKMYIPAAGYCSRKYLLLDVFSSTYKINSVILMLGINELSIMENILKLLCNFKLSSI